MSEYLPVIAVLTVIFACSAGRRFGHLSLISLFVYAQAIMAAGTLPSLAPDIPADQDHCALIMWTFSALVATAAIYSYTTPNTRATYSPQVDFAYPRTPVWVLIVLSLVVSVLYFYAVGYLAIVDSIRSLINGTGEDIAGLRLQSYAGDQYFYPGYVNQFKNSLLPALVIVALAAAFHFRSSSRLLIVGLLVPATLVVLLGTGQRGAFVLVMVLAVVAANRIVPKKTTRYIARISFVALPLFFLSTFASGRAGQELVAAESMLDKAGVLFQQLAFRILGSNQLSSVVGFRYIHDRELNPLQEWWTSIVGLLPGQRGSDLSNQIFAVLYGSTRGTAPLSLWGSVYHNLGSFGAVVFAILIAAIFCRISQVANSVKRATTIQLIGTAGVTATLGMWIADGPVSVINTGLVVYVFLWAWGARLTKRQWGRSAHASHMSFQ